MRDLTLTELDRVQSQGAEADVPLQLDEDAFAAFYARTSRTLWRYLARITGDRQFADDLLQESYYRFLRADATYESEQHRRNALFRIATNLARDRHRRQVVRPAAVANSEEVLAGYPASAGTDVGERAADLRRAMSHLRPRARAMLWLAYGEGSSHQEIADVMGLRRASVKMLLFRARRQVAALLGGGASGSERDA
jgi:RNA polymerase sigma-70 factor (ECF subfamily)